MMAGAKGKRGFDLDRDAGFLRAGAVVRTVNEKAPGFDGSKALKACGHPVLGFNGAEGQCGRDFLAGDLGDQAAQFILVERVGGVDLDVPLALGDLKGRRGDMFELFRQHIGEPLGGLRVRRDAGEGGGFLNRGIHRLSNG